MAKKLRKNIRYLWWVHPDWTTAEIKRTIDFGFLRYPSIEAIILHHDPTRYQISNFIWRNMAYRIPTKFSRYDYYSSASFLNWMRPSNQAIQKQAAF